VWAREISVGVIGAIGALLNSGVPYGTEVYYSMREKWVAQPTPPIINCLASSDYPPVS